MNRMLPLVLVMLALSAAAPAADAAPSKAVEKRAPAPPAHGVDGAPPGHGRDAPARAAAPVPAAHEGPAAPAKAASAPEAADAGETPRAAPAAAPAQPPADAAATAEAPAADVGPVTADPTPAGAADAASGAPKPSAAPEPRPAGSADPVAPASEETREAAAPAPGDAGSGLVPTVTRPEVAEVAASRVARPDSDRADGTAASLLVAAGAVAAGLVAAGTMHVRIQARRAASAPTPLVAPMPLVVVKPAAPGSGEPVVELAPSCVRDVREALQWGQQAVQRGALERGVRWFDRAVELAPQVAVAHFCRGVCLAGLERHQAAYAALRAACALAPDEAEYRVHLARTCLRIGRPNEAMDALAPVLSALPEVGTAALEDDSLAALRDHPRFLAMVGAL